MRRVLAICLDGYEPSLASELMAAGELPATAELAARSARFALDHGPALRTGLAGEHVATGLSPRDSGRWAAVHFDPASYEVWQEGTSQPPFPAAMSQRTVVFDPPYFDLDAAPSVAGIVNWGAHDPGVPSGSRPDGLLQEVTERFGEYPARRWIYGLPWSSPEASLEMGRRLTAAVEQRTRIASWLLTERLPEWDLALLTVSEPHSAIEGLWHGVDPTHPLHTAPSAGPAGEGVRGVYRAIDRLLQTLTEQLPDTAIVYFSMHGMGPNRSDAGSLLLLAELLYRREFGRPLFDRTGQPDPSLNGQVALPADATWRQWVAEGFTPPPERPDLARRMLRPLLSRLRPARPVPAAPERQPGRIPIHWIPATRYRADWPRMRAFALPSYYDGRIRINLQGRERAGLVPLAEYRQERDRLIELVCECVDPITGETVVELAELPDVDDPRALSATQADVVFVWKGAPTGFSHPRLGQIGPVPYRRTGGHTGSYGLAYLANTPVAPGDHGVRSAFDVVPTLVDLVGGASNFPLSGRSLIGQ